MSTGEQGGRSPQPIAPAKFWLKSALFIVAVGIVIAIAWLQSLPKEPSYQGKSLSEWLIVHEQPSINWQEQLKATMAIRQIGNNGLPTLLQMIKTPDSTLKIKLKALFDKQRIFKFTFAEASSERSKAVTGLRILGDDAKAAVPELITLMRGAIGTDGRWEAICALGNIGPAARAAIPPLLAIASDANDPNRTQAISTLGLIRSSPESVVPFLASCLRDPEEDVRYSAASSLSWFGEAAHSSASALTASLTDPSEAVRNVATNTLKRIDREAATKAGIP